MGHSNKGWIDSQEIKTQAPQFLWQLISSINILINFYKITYTITELIQSHAVLINSVYQNKDSKLMNISNKDLKQQ